ncbi:MAG: hypothetical protein O7G86_03495 [Gammaproteobacteria bacterium]|nr:hypothetical protein [Gammaproteobacteria bacterium]MCZ6852964.1 hypothetical protein [Gammaproteobacteria bacterium]
MSKVSDIDQNDPLLQRARALTTEVMPPEDLWPSIHNRLRQRPRSIWTSPRLAVAAVLLVSISSGLTVWLDGGLRDPSNNSNPAYVAVALNPQHLVMGPQFVQARTDLVLSLEKQLDELSPQSRQVLADNLRNIDEAISEINAALVDNPNSALLLHLLLSTYTDQLTLLGTIESMTRSANESERTQL